MLKNPELIELSFFFKKKIMIWQREFLVLMMMFWQMLYQVFNEINSREMQKINVFRGIISNWIFIAVIAATVAFQVVIIEFLGTFASTVPLNWQHWLLSVGLGSISLIVGVILKCIPVGSGETSATPNGYSPLANDPDDI